MPVEIDFWFHYTCPLSLLTRRLISVVAQDLGARVRSHPFERTRADLWDVLPLRQVWDHSVLPLAERVGIPMGETPPDRAAECRLAFQGYQYARVHGLGDIYNDHVFFAHFQERADIGDLSTLSRIAGRAGLDPQDFRRATVSREYEERHQSALEPARTITLTPTAVVGCHRIEGVPQRGQLYRLIGEAGRKPSPRTRVGVGFC